MAESNVAAEGRDTTLNIYQRINAVMSDVGGHIEKDGKVEIRGTGGGKAGYEYITHDAVTAHIRPALVKHGIAVRPEVIKHDKDTNRTELTVQVDFINIDNPEDCVSIQTIGYGCDNQDKGPGKALSYAVKYAYLKQFMLNSSDDIELDDIEHERPDVQAEKIAQEARAKVSEADQRALSNLKHAIENADSVELIDDLMKENKGLLDRVPNVTREFFEELAANNKREMENG